MLLKITKYDEHQKGLASMVYNFFHKHSCYAVHSERT